MQRLTTVMIYICIVLWVDWAPLGSYPVLLDAGWGHAFGDIHLVAALSGEVQEDFTPTTGPLALFRALPP